MEIRYRMADIEKLKCNACQDFLKIAITNPNWREKLYNIAKESIENDRPYKIKYIPVFQKMRENGFEDYSIENMDITLMNALISNCPEIISVTKQTKNCMQLIADDRNETDGHSDKNETDEELYSSAIVSLHILRNFIKTIDRTELSVIDEQRSNYFKHYSLKIRELINIIVAEWYSTVKIEKDVQKDINYILQNERPSLELSNIMLTYEKESRRTHDRTKIETLALKASEAGIVGAHIFAAMVLQKNEDIKGCETKLWLLLKSDEFNVTEAHSVITEINSYKRKHTKITEEMEKMIVFIKEKGINIEIDQAGFYSINRKN